MIKKTLGEVESLVNGRELLDKYKNLTINGVSTDSRNIEAGNLFFPLKGENFDGHEFATMAMDKGAIAIVASEKLDLDLPIIYVNDTGLALQDLARAYIEEVNPFVLGITGSNGKTSTKDIIASILARKYKTHKTKGNFNNTIGLPLTILDMDSDTEMLVLEMGIDHFGEMDILSKIARPNIGLITNAGEAHLDDLGTKENVARAKMEFLTNMKENPVYFYFKDDENLENLSSTVPENIQKISFGLADSSDYMAEIDHLSHKGSYIKMPRLSNKPFFIPLIGKHQAYNVAAALAVADFLKISEEDIRLGLENVEATGMRNEIKTNGKLTILDDSYKSNPSSLLAALETLYSLDGYDQKIAILGDMLGIGDDIEQMHRDIGRLIDEKQIDYIIGIGYYSEYIIWEAEERFGQARLIHFEEKPDNIVEVVNKIRKNNPIILVKASRPLELDTIVADLLED